MKKGILLITLLVFRTGYAQKDPAYKHQDKVASIMEQYMAKVDNKDIEGMYKYFAMPLVLHFNANNPYHIKSKEEFNTIFNAWKHSPKADFHSTRIESIRVNNAFINYFCVADVTYSRLDSEGNVIKTQRVLYNFVKGSSYSPLGILFKWFKRWKIYMITNVELVE